MTIVTNNFSLLLNLSRDFSSLRAFGGLFQTFGPVKRKTIFEIVSSIFRELKVHPRRT